MAAKNSSNMSISKDHIELEYGISFGDDEKILMLKTPNFKAAFFNDLKEHLKSLLISFLIFGTIVLIGKYCKWNIDIISTLGFFGIVVLIGIFNSIKTLYKVKNTKIIITNQSVIITESAKIPSVKCIQLDAIESLELKRSFIDKRFDTGTIKIYTGKTKNTDEGQEKIYDQLIAVSEPDKVYLLLRNRINFR